MGDTTWGVDLQFTKTLCPYKGRTYLGRWLVIPRFIVKGSIYHEGTQISCSGHGYHDHNLYPITAPFTTKGYHFGKIPFGQNSFTWAHVLKSKTKTQPILIISTKDKYFSIDVNDITYTTLKHSTEHNKTIPVDWNINVEAPDIHLDVTLESLHRHYVSVPSVHYWRYHTKNTGHITMNSHNFPINNIEISEYLKFF